MNRKSESTRKYIGKRLRAARIAKHLTQQDLASSLGVDRQYIWKIENGKINVTMDYLEKIIDLLGMTQEQFFRTDNTDKC